MHWEDIGFPSNWRPEEIWEAFKKIYDALKQDEQNRLTGLDEIKKNLRQSGVRKAIQSKLRDLADIVGNPSNKLDSMDISKTDGG